MYGTSKDYIVFLSGYLWVNFQSESDFIEFFCNYMSFPAVMFDHEITGYHISDRFAYFICLNSQTQTNSKFIRKGFCFAFVFIPYL